MRQFIAVLLLAATLLASGMSGAFAVDVTGRYATETQPVTTFDLIQTGTALTGRLTGGDQGSLTGTVNGDEMAGTIALEGVGEIAFRATWAAGGFELLLVGENGTFPIRLVPAGPQAGTAEPDYYWLANGERHGPVPLSELRQLLTTGAVGADALVWTDGMADWAQAGDVAELAASVPNTADYYVLDGSERIGPMKIDTLISRLRSGATRADGLVWKAGLGDWVRADSLPELTAALEAPPAPPAQPPQPQTPPQQPPTPEGPPPEPANKTAQTITLPWLSDDLPTADRKKYAAVLGAVIGVFFHEVGHAIIGELDVPSVGPEEDAADEFSSMLIATSLKQSNLEGATDARKALVKDLVEYSTLLWHHLDESKSISLDWSDEHSGSARRFRNTLCRVFGSDPQTYKDLADRVQLPENQRQLCSFEYSKHLRAWLQVTANVARDPGDGTGVPGNPPANTPGKTVSLVFEPSQIGTGQALAPVFQQSGWFEAFAEALTDGFVWTKRDFEIRFRDCGVINAWYAPAEGKIHMCWEMVEFFAGTILDAEKIPRN